jgi:hypothetical protein
MKKILLSLVLLSGAASAFSMGNMVDSVDKHKAKESVDTKKAKEAAKKGTDITMDDVKGSVDADKAKKSVDMKKLKKSFSY